MVRATRGQRQTQKKSRLDGKVVPALDPAFRVANLAQTCTWHCAQPPIACSQKELDNLQDSPLPPHKYNVLDRPLRPHNHSPFSSIIDQRVQSLSRLCSRSIEVHKVYFRHAARRPGNVAPARRELSLIWQPSRESAPCFWRGSLRNRAARHRT